MKIIADAQIPFAREAFSPFGEVVLCDGREITPDNLNDADILLVRSVTTVDSDLLKRSNIRFVATATSGTDHVDIDYLHEAGIAFAAAAGSNARSVVEYVLSGLFVLASQGDFELTDKTVGIIGCGQVGSRLLEFLQVLGIECLVTDPPLEEKTGQAGLVDFEAIYQADIISLHVSLTDTGDHPTSHMMDRTVFSCLKPDVIIVNTARGEVIVENDLKEFLSRNEKGSAILDVWENEPYIDQELLARVNIGTPHIAGYSTDGKIRATRMVYDSFCDYFSYEKHWDPVYGFRDSGLHSILIDSEISNYDALQFAVLTHYDVRSDTAALRRMLELDPEKRGYYFDELRKHYPVRREFTSTEICLDKGRDVLADQFRRLGFRVTEN